MQQELFGFLVCEERMADGAWGFPEDCAAPGGRLRWPLCSIQECPMLARWTKDGAFPELYDPRMLAHDYDYVQAYQEQCAVLGIRTRIYAFASDGMVFTRFPWGKQAEFIGYDCVDETGFCSYLYWDNPSGEELAGIGLHTNANGLFAARRDAELYGRFRRLQLRNGACIEDMGNEMPAAVARIHAYHGGMPGRTEAQSR